MRPTMRLTIPTLTATAFFAGSSILAGPAAHAGEFPHRPIQLVAQADPGAPPIERGERSELAAWWQDRLNTWLQLSGSSTGQIVVDGWYGPNTEAATLEFQESTDEVPADGVVDPEDRVALAEAIMALETDPGAPPIERGERSELAAWWQDRLNTWLQLSGSSTGQIVVDGWYGPNTEAATLEFQESTDEVPADGVVDPEDRVALAEAIMALETDPGAPPIERGERSELAAWWQDRLNTWLQLSGSSTGQIVVDGWYGPNTEAATLEFQESTDEVPADGVVDPEDRVALHDAIVALGGSSPIDDGADDGTDDGADDSLPSGEFSADDTSAEGTATLTAQLSDVTTAARQVGDRIEFTFGAGDASGTVGYEIGYVDEAPAGASGEPVEVDGDALLQVVLRPAAGYDPATGSETYTGPDRVTFDESLVISEAVLVVDFEGVMTWVIGTRSEAPFRVASSEDPTRVVVEISHETD
ncbi:MAG: peptidoglycan-binding protein [Ilumatobacteraceae bacterium]|nr:peptidoglycan-binding protein [Ilumatobacteraceae bacterium]